MKKRLVSLLLIVALCLVPMVQLAAATASSETAAYDAMIALKDQYPEGMRWTNDNYYGWKGGIYSGGYGCAGFAFLLSDAAFGELPARKLTNFSFSDVRVGDILRVNNDTHSVIVLEFRSSGVIIAEGNYNSSIHWGRAMTQQEVERADYLMTRWPETQTEPEPEQPAQPEPEQPTQPAISFPDVPANDYFTEPVAWAVEQGIVNGRDDGRFDPYGTCNQQEIIVMLWRAAGQPAVAEEAPVAADSFAAAAVNWAYSKGMVDETFERYAPCTRATAVNWMWEEAGSPGGGSSSFPDVPAEYAAPVSWAVAKGVTYGNDAGNFDPFGICNRAQIVTFLFRAK